MTGNVPVILSCLILAGGLIFIAVTIMIIKGFFQKASDRLSDVRTTLELASDVIDGIKEISDACPPSPKTVGKATGVYLPRIAKDFPDFHASDAESEIKQVLESYLFYRYGADTEFNSNLIHTGLFESLHKECAGDVTNIRYNGTAIYGYTKDEEYATIHYRCSVGFDLNGKRQETRYEIAYTCRLSDCGVTSVGMKCPNCGAPLSDTALTVCPYCDVKIIRDTIMNWEVTGITEY